MLPLSARCRRDFVVNESHSFFKNLLHQFRRRSFHIDTHQRLGAGRPQQHPCVRAFVFDRRIKEKLDAVKILFA